MVSALAGGLIGYFGVGLGDNVLTFNYDTFMVLVYGITALSIVVILWFMYQANHYHNHYESMGDDADEDNSYEVYRKTFKNLEFATIFYNASVALILLSIFGDVYGFHDRIVSGAALNFTAYVKDIIFLALLIIFQVTIFKLTQKIRYYKLSAMPTIKEVKEFAYSYDEGSFKQTMNKLS